MFGSNIMRNRNESAENEWAMNIVTKNASAINRQSVSLGRKPIKIASAEKKLIVAVPESSAVLILKGIELDKQFGKKSV